MRRSQGVQPLEWKLRCCADTTNHYRKRGMEAVMDEYRVVRASAMEFVVYYYRRIIAWRDNRYNKKLYDHTMECCLIKINLFLFVCFTTINFENTYSPINRNCWQLLFVIHVFDFQHKFHSLSDKGPVHISWYVNEISTIINNCYINKRCNILVYLLIKVTRHIRKISVSDFTNNK